MKKVWLPLMGLLLFAGGSVFFLFGFRVSKTLEVSSPGSLTVTFPASDAFLYIDGAYALQNNKILTPITKRFLAKGEHTIIVSKPGFWPWSKKVTIESGIVTTISPFLMSKTPHGSLIPESDPEYYRLVSLIEESLDMESIKSSDEQYLLSKNEKTLYLIHEGVPKKVWEGVSLIRSFSFYPGRVDVALIALDTGIYAVELTDNPDQNLAPLYKGLEPVFSLTPNKSLIIKDYGTLVELSL